MKKYKGQNKSRWRKDSDSYGTEQLNNVVVLLSSKTQNMNL